MQKKRHETRPFSICTRHAKVVQRLDLVAQKQLRQPCGFIVGGCGNFVEARDTLGTTAFSTRNLLPHTHGSSTLVVQTTAFISISHDFLLSVFTTDDA